MGIRPVIVNPIVSVLMGSAAPTIEISSLPDILVSGELATVSGTSNAEGQTVTVTIGGQPFGAPGAGIVIDEEWSITGTPTDAMKSNSVAVVATVGGVSASSTTHVLPSGIVAGFDARLGVDTRVSGPDTFATDITAQFPVGSEPVASQAAADSQPAYDGTQLGFDGTDDYMTLGAGLGAHTSHTFVAVISNLASSSDRILLDSQTGRLALVLHEVSGSLRIGWLEGSTFVNAAAPFESGLSVVSWVLVAGGTGKIFRNTVEVASGAFTGTSMGSAPVLGARYDAVLRFWHGSVAAIYAYPSDLSDADRAIVETALADVHGVTL